MKRFIPCLLLLPLLSSCVAQDTYYQPGYYPPPPSVEYHRHESARYGASRHQHQGYRAAPQARVYEGQRNQPGNAHGHVSGNGGQAVVVRPNQAPSSVHGQSRPQASVNAAPRQVNPHRPAVHQRPQSEVSATVEQHN